jgi:hypothetical protein
MKEVKAYLSLDDKLYATKAEAVRQDKNVRHAQHIERLKKIFYDHQRLMRRDPGSYMTADEVASMIEHNYQRIGDMMEQYKRECKEAEDRLQYEEAMDASK